MQKTIFAAVLAAFLMFCKCRAYAVDITASGGWVELLVDSSGLSAGENRLMSYESRADATILDITGTADGKDAWLVRVRKSDGSWPEGVTVSLKRTDDGNGGGAINGGTSYTDISGSYVDFFDGSGDRTSILVQYKISGVAATLSPAVYGASITFTVVDI